MNYIKIWCEYDFDGDFGGCNNAGCYKIHDDWSTEDIDKKVLNMLTSRTRLSEEELEGLYDWKWVSIKEL